MSDHPPNEASCGQRVGSAGGNIGPADRQAGGNVFAAVSHDHVRRPALELAQLRPFHLWIEARPDYPAAQVADDGDVIAIGKIGDAAGVNLDVRGLPEDPYARPGLFDQPAQCVAADLTDHIVNADQ